jgi:hypothetical protein
MNETGKMFLRSRFEAETDIQLSSCPAPEEWQYYAEWLENRSIRELNEEQIEKNESLYKLIWTTIHMLEDKVSRI